MITAVQPHKPAKMAGYLAPLGSPSLSNIYPHEVFDKWFVESAKGRFRRTLQAIKEWGMEHPFVRIRPWKYGWARRSGWRVMGMENPGKQIQFKLQNTVF